MNHRHHSQFLPRRVAPWRVPVRVALFPLLLALSLPAPLSAQARPQPEKIVPLRFCVVDTGDTSAQNGRLDIRTLLNVVRQKNVIWSQCNVQFRLNRNAVNLIADVLDPPLGAGSTGDIRDPGTLLGLLEYLVTLLKCNAEAGADAFEKMTEDFIRAFVNAAGAKTGVLGATITPAPCRKPFVGWKPMVIDPNWFAAPLPDLGRVLAHENGHALSLQHSAIPGDLMFPTFAGGGLVLSAAECTAARREAQKISGTVDKNRRGRPQRRAAPRTRMVVDELNQPLKPGSDLAEYVVTVGPSRRTLALTSIVAGVPERSEETYIYRFFLDADANPRTGGNPGEGSQVPTEFGLADFYAEMKVVLGGEPRVLEHRAFVFLRGTFRPVPRVAADVAIFSIQTETEDIPAVVVVDLDVSEPIVLRMLRDGFRSMGSLEAYGAVDESPVLTGSLRPFQEPTLLEIRPPRGPQGASVALRGRGFAPNVEAEISVGLDIVAKVRTDRRGSFRTAIEIPSREPGPLSIMAVDEEYASDVKLFDLVGRSGGSAPRR